jgi:hypothetical protein
MVSNLDIASSASTISQMGELIYILKLRLVNCYQIAEHPKQVAHRYIGSYLDWRDLCRNSKSPALISRICLKMKLNEFNESVLYVGLMQ